MRRFRALPPMLLSCLAAAVIAASGLPATSATAQQKEAKAQGQDKGQGQPVTPTVQRSEFGTTEREQGGLIGTFYDLKQTQKRQTTGMSTRQYMEVLGDFLSNNWDENILNHYFRAARSLYTTQLFIPTMKADAAPEAFGVGGIVKPRMWVAHYKGQVVPPSDGQWRFWGLGDDILCVAVNEKIVLVSNWAGQPFPKIPWRPPADPPPCKHFGGGARIVPGDWIDLKGGVTVDLDILIGELPGNLFSSFVLIEKRGETYDSSNGYPRLNIFQLAKFDTPTPPAGKAPVFAPNGPVWKGVE